MTDDMIEFFLGCIAKDEAVANAAWHGDGWKVEPNRQADEVWTNEHAGPGHAPIPIAKAWDAPTGGHIARWDPARVLAECEAKRRIVELHSRRDSRLGRPLTCECLDAWPCATLKLLTLPYAGHPDYNPDWRP